VITRTVKEIVRKFVPLGRINGPAFRNRLGSLAGSLAEGFVGHGRARKTDDGIAFAERIVRRQIEKSGNDLAFCEIAGSAKQNDSARFGGTAVGNVGRNAVARHKLS